MGRYVLWGSPTENEMDEQPITSSDTKDDPKFVKARQWAESKGFRFFRIADTDRASFTASVR